MIVHGTLTGCKGGAEMCVGVLGCAAVQQADVAMTASRLRVVAVEEKAVLNKAKNAKIAISRWIG
jgi:hypothetical protein